MKRLMIFILAVLMTPGGGVWASGTTGAVYFGADETQGYLSDKSLDGTHVDLDSTAQKTLRNQSSGHAHHVMSFEVPIDESGILGVPTGRTIETVTLYVGLAGASAAAVGVEVYEVSKTLDSPTWLEYDDDDDLGWTNIVGDDNDDHTDPADAGLLDSGVTGSAGAHTLTFDLADHGEVPSGTMSAAFTMQVLVRLSSTGWANAYTQGTSRYRVVVTYSGSQPPTPTPSPTPSNTPTFTPTPTATPTGTPTPSASPTPTVTPSPSPTGRPILAYMGPASWQGIPLQWDFVNNQLVLPATGGIKFGNDSVASTAGAVTSVTDLTDLADTPGTYAGDALEILRVNAGETGVEFVPINTIAAEPTHTHTTDQVTEGSNQYWTSERTEDQVNSLIVAGDGLDKTYSDAGNSLTLDVAGLTVSEFASANVSQWTNDANYLTSVSGISFDAIDSGLDEGAIPFGAADESGTFDATNLFWDDANNRLGLRTAAPDTLLHLLQNDSSTEPGIQVRQDSTGDAALRFRLGASTADWTLGIDNSDSDNFKISASGALGTSDAFAMTSAGNIGLAGTAIPAGHSNWRTLTAAGGSVMLGHTNGGSMNFNSNAYYDGAWKFQGGTGLRAANLQLNAGAFLMRGSNATGNAGGAITWTNHLSTDTSGNVDIDNNLNVDGSGVIDQGLTVGQAGNTIAIPVSGAALEPSSSAGTQDWDYTPVSDYWSPTAIGSTDRISARAPIAAAGSVLESIRFHVYDTDPTNNEWDFAVVSTIHTTSGAPSNSAIAITLNTSMNLSGTQKGSTDHYYYTFSTGNFPYTIGALDAIQAQVAADADSVTTSMALYMIEFVYRARKY